MATTKRQPVKALVQSASAILENAKAEKARKAASRKALRESLKQANITEQELVAAAKFIEQVETPARLEQVNHGADNLAAARIEADTTGMTFEEACESMGIDPTTGLPTTEEKARYNGPMLALVAARRSYVKAKNGVQCNGDELALTLGNLKPDQVITTCIRALRLEGNPYTHLNVGQQSMNLRNKLRHAIKSGAVTMGEVKSLVTG